MSLEHLSEIQIDTIREISNIGMGNAATALSQMIGKPVNITVPEAAIIGMREVAAVAGGEETEVAASYVQVVGQARGHLMLMYTMDSARRLVELLAPGAGLDPATDEMGRSAVQEIGNILGASFLRSLAEMTQLSLLPTVPAVAVDYAGSIVTYVVSNLEDYSEQIVLVKTDFDIEGDRIEGHCLFIPEAESLERILESLGVGG